MKNNKKQKSLIAWFFAMLLVVPGLLVGQNTDTGETKTLPGNGESIEVIFYIVDHVGDVGLYSSISYTNGELCFSYYDNTNGNLKFARGNDGVYQIDTVDQVGNVGKYSSLLVDGAGHENMVYFDDTKNTLKFAGWLRTWEFETIDSDGDVGLYSSIEIDNNNELSISYYDNTNQNLKYAKQSAGSWTTQIIDETGDVGKYTCLVKDLQNHNNIVYFDDTKNTLKFAGWLRTWEFETIDSGGDVGLYSSIELNTNNELSISYYDNTNQNLKYAKQSAGSWTTQIIDEEGDVGKYTCLVKDPLNNNNNIVYFDDTKNTLKFAGWLRAWEFETIDAGGDVGLYSSIACNDYNQLYISYYDNTNKDLKFSTLDGTTWTNEVIASIDDVGKYTSLAISKPGFGNNANIVYFDDTQNDLLFAGKDLPVTDVGNIAGMVTNEILGLPLNDAIVSAINDATAVSYGMQTNEEGSYEIKNIPPGTYTVKASKNGYSPQTTTEVLVSNGSTTEVNFVLTPTILPIGTLAGNVINETTQQAISEANIEATNNATGTTYPGQTNDEGSYQIENLPAGIYTIEASKAGYLSLIINDVEIITGETSHLDFILEVDISVKGSIAGLITDELTGQPIAEANAKAVNDETGAVFMDQTGEDGTYELENVPSGVYTVELTAEDYFVQTTSNVVVNPGETTQVDFVLPFIGIIAGTVTEDFLGLPIADASLVAVNNGTGLSYFAESSGNGTFGFEALPPETYTVEISADGYFSETIPNIVVSSGNISIVDFSLTFIVSLEGIITDFTTLLPVQGAEIILTGQNESYQITSDGDGYYGFFELAAGTYNITITKGGYQTENLILNLTEPLAYQQDFDLDPVAESSLAINDELTAFADEIVESPTGFYKLSGDVNINGVLYFNGEVKVDKRAGSEKYILGNDKIFAQTASGTYNINELKIPWEFIIQNELLIVNSAAYFFDMPVMIQGFPLTLNAIEIGEKESGELFVSTKVIPKFPFPLDKIVEAYTKPKVLSEFTFALTYDDSGEHIDDVNILIENFNLKLFKINSVHIQYEYTRAKFAGMIAIQIPGDIKAKDCDNPDIAQDLLNTPIELHDSVSGTQHTVSFAEFLELTGREKGDEPLELELGLEFIDGKIDKLYAEVGGLDIPLPIAGMKLTRIKGGVYDLTKKQITVTMDVDIETGFEIPLIDKAPLSLVNLGVTIKPWDFFEGHGTIQILENPISGGHIRYVKNQGLGMAGWMDAAFLRGDVNINIAKRKLSGNSMLEISTPPKDQIEKRAYRWLGGQVLGSFLTDFKFDGIEKEYFITATIEKEFDLLFDKKTLALTQRFSFDDQAPYVHLDLGINHNTMIHIFKGRKDGKEAIEFQVPENTPQIMIVAEDSINHVIFDFSLQNPQGRLFDKDNAYYEQFEDVQQTVMLIDQPMAGDWFFLTDYEGEVALYTEAVDQEPTAFSLEPQNRRTRSNVISLDFTDYADTLGVEVYFDTDSRDYNGTFIDQFTLVNNGNLEFVWQNDDIANGEYFIYSRVDDGKNRPVIQYAPGSIWVENDPDTEIPQNFSADQDADSVIVSWSKPVSDKTFAAVTYWKNISTGAVDELTVVDEEQAVIFDLDYGQEYQLWACFINENGTYSSPSNKVNLIFSSQSRNNPPYFTLNPDSTFVFVVDQEWQYTLTANDADGNDLTFEILNDTLGISLNGDLMTWTPTEEQKGVYNLMLTVSDGADLDTAYQQLIVYTKHQVGVDLAFSSVNLYEDDNMFVKIGNYFCPDYYQQVTLRNIRTQEVVPVECRRVNDFEYIGQFGLSFINRSEIAVANGDTIELKYNYGNYEYLAYAYYDSLPQPSDQNPPGTIIDLEIEKLANNQLQLKWTATGNDGEDGKAYKYDIRYAYEPIVSEDVYFTAFLIDEFPYPSFAGETDSLIIDLNELTGVHIHDTVYLSVKAEDEMQNRGALSNSPGENCLISPQDMQAEIVDVFKINLEWSGPTITQKGETGFEYYNLYRKFKQGYFYLLTSGIESNSFTDNLQIKPDGIYQYAIQAKYETGVSDTLFSLPVDLDRYEDVSILCSLEDSTNYQGISFKMQGMDTVYTQTFNRTTNPTGLVLLGNVFKSSYAIEISKEGFDPLIDTIEISKQQTTFDYMLQHTLRTVNVGITEGWSGISIPINPLDGDIETLLNPILSDLIILQNSSGMYWPGENVNTLGAWNTHEGYQIKVANDVELTITGARENDKTLQFDHGWNLIPVISECDVDVATLFNATDVGIVKEVAGWNVYWPEFGINTLGVLNPGKAYFVLMGDVAEITFPECGGLKGNSIRGGKTVINTNTRILSQVNGLRNEIIRTAITHSIVIPINAISELQPGTVIEAYDVFGRCCGFIAISSESAALTLFGDDPLTSEKDGFAEGEPIEFKFFDPETDSETKLHVLFNESMPDYSGCFKANGLSAIKSLTIGTDTQNAEIFSETWIYPNPTTGLLQISGVKGDYQVEVFNAVQEAIFTTQLSGKDQIDLSAYPKGMYLIKITTHDFSITKKVVVN